MKSASRMCWAFLLAAILAIGISRPIFADDDPPGRVARLNLAQGSVSFQPAGGGDNDWTAAVVNRPMSTGDRLWTDQDGRAELHVGSTAIRLDHNTGISFLTLADNGVQLQLSAGTTTVRLRRLDPTDSFEIDAPNLAFSLLRPGDYRVDVNPDTNITTVTVVQGQGAVIGGGRSYNIIADQRATFTGTDNLQYDLSDPHATPQTDFDTWASSRDQQDDKADAAPSAKYVSPEVTGSQDLDTYGAWQTSPDYGPMWVPSGVAVGWAPYRFGHWVWIAPWGWTWVEDEPWGFAPFHYGRWVSVGGVWGWIPGPVAVRPVYAPALVAWVGGTPGFSFSVSIGAGGGIGWFPLGPREVFVPGYRVSDAYVTRVNVTNTVVERTTVVNVYHNNVTNITYVNQHVNGGVTVVSHDTFVNAGPVGRNVVRVPDRELAAAPVARTHSEAPVHSSLVGEGRPATARPPAAIINRTVVTRRTPAPEPPRFQEQSGALPNRGENQPPARGFQPSQAQPSQPQPTQPQSGNRAGTRGFDQPGAPAQPQPQSQPTQPQPGNRGGTRGFDQPGAPAQPQPQQRGAGENVNRNAPPPANPFARPAPPVHQPTPAEQQNDAAKLGQYQQQHQEVHQKAAPAKPAEKPAGREKKN
jgi:hypothetical protein